MTRYYFLVGSRLILRVSTKQLIVVLSSIEAEYKAVCFTSCEVL